jgi:simple sugar transport system ATP-binding protein
LLLTPTNHIIEAKNIVRDFPGVRALNCVNFDAKSGEVNAIVGANGAGKSTLAKILAGVYPPNEGELAINYEKVIFTGPADAKKAGVVCAYQEVDTALVPYISVTENVFLNRLANSKQVMVNWRKLHEDAEELLARVNLEIDVRQPVSDLSLHEKQKVVIAQALEGSAKFLILDEPTAPLSLREVDQLFELITQLTQDGLGIIYISHRMAEIFSIADRVTVMRDGRNVATVKPGESSVDEVVFLMLDKTIAQEFARKEQSLEFGEVLLETNKLDRFPLVKDVSIQVKAGEVLGMTGLVGAGKTELARVLFGADRPHSGEILLKGKVVSFRSPSDAVQKGLMLVPEERRQQGVLVEMPIVQNLSLPNLESMTTWFGLVRRKFENKAASKIVSELGIICQSIQQKVKFLSGGNQQKVAVGKWLITPGQIFIFDEPTKGVDVGAKAEILRLVRELANANSAVIYFSSEIPEILKVSDRILVLFDGQIVAEFNPNEATQDTILKFATGTGEENDN